MRALGILFVLLVTALSPPAFAAPPSKEPSLLRTDNLPFTLTDRGVELTVESAEWERWDEYGRDWLQTQRLVLRGTLRDRERPDRIWVENKLAHRVGYSYLLLEQGQLRASLGMIDPRCDSMGCEFRLCDATATEADRGFFRETLTFAGLPFPTSKTPEKLDIRQRTKQGTEIIIAAMGKADHIEARYAIIARPPQDDPGRDVSVSIGERVLDEQGNNIAGYEFGIGWGEIDDDDDLAPVALTEPRTVGQTASDVELLDGKPAAGGSTISLDLDVTEEIPWRAKPDTERRFTFWVALPAPLPPRRQRQPLGEQWHDGVRVSIERCDRDIDGPQPRTEALVVVQPPPGSPGELHWQPRLAGERPLAGENEIPYSQVYWHSDGSPLAPEESAWLVPLQDVPANVPQTTFALRVRRQARAQEEVWLRHLPMPRLGETIEPKTAVRTKLGPTVELSRIVYYLSDESLLALNPDMHDVWEDDGVAIQLRVRNAGSALAALAARCGIGLPPQGKPTVTASIRPVLRDAYPEEWPGRWASGESLGSEHGELVADIWHTLAKPNPHAKRFDLEVTLTLATPMEESPELTFVGIPITNVSYGQGREVE